MRIQTTESGLQRAHVLALRSVPYWLTGIDAKRTWPELREEIIRYQKEAVDVLYSWAQSPRVLPTPTTRLVPAEAPAKPIAPQAGTSYEEWITYHQQMTQWYLQMQEVESRLQIVEHRQNEFEDRIESLEAITDLIPEILERLGPETLTPEHQRDMQVYVRRLSQASGKHPNTIHEDLKTAFHKPRYQGLLEDEWPQVENWFKIQIERAKR